MIPGVITERVRPLPYYPALTHPVFFAGAVIWGPWTSLSMAVFQDATPPAALAQVIAARSSLLILAAPLGTALGGPIVAALGARGTLLAPRSRRSRSGC
jgi:hypothetical protein